MELFTTKLRIGSCLFERFSLTGTGFIMEGVENMSELMISPRQSKAGGQGSPIFDGKQAWAAQK